MSDPQTKDEEERPAPVTEPYVPFPSFESWLLEPFDSSAFDLFAAELEADKKAASPSVLADAIAQATRWAAVNTGAIEGLYEVDRGFTYSVAVSAAAWADLHKAKDQAAVHAMQDQLAAYEYVLDATTKSYPVIETWLRSLHEIVTASQDTYATLTEVGWQDQQLPKGEYKTQPNSPLNLATNVVHSYASPLETAAEMHRFMTELGSPAFLEAHPVVQAAYAHYAFVCIHPFADGNGRVSRALASVYLYRAPGVPLVIFADQKGEYIDALEAADAGDTTRFVRFISERVIDTVGMVRAEMETASVQSVSDQLTELAPILTGHGGLPHTEVDAISKRILDLFDDAIRKGTTDAPLSGTMSYTLSRMDYPQVNLQVPERADDYRTPPGSQPAIQFWVQSSQPASAQKLSQIAVAISRPLVDGADFVVYTPERILLKVYLREVHPVISAAVTFRAQAAAGRLIREMVAATAAQVRASLESNGYVIPRDPSQHT